MRRYMFIPSGAPRPASLGRSFEGLIDEISRHGRPSIVVVEDIDRLFDVAGVAPQYFLNVLDGLLRPASSTLWIATCNDPTDLPDNLTDRPGRFDRILVFPDPGMEERARLIERYAELGLSDAERRELAASAAGLTKAHIAEACWSAAERVRTGVGEYAARLGEEIAVLRGQCEAAGRYARAVRGERVGF